MITKAKIKKIFSIELILICFGLITLGISIYYKYRASRLFAEYEREIVRLIFLNNDSQSGAGDSLAFEKECEVLKDLF